MHQQFEEINSNTGIKRFIDGKQKDLENKNATYEYFERPMKKQMKFYIHEGQSNSSFSSTSTNVLQPPVEQFKNIFSMPLNSEQVVQILSTLKQVFKTHTEHCEIPGKHVNLHVSKEQSISKTVFKTDERPSKEVDFCGSKEHPNSVVLSSSTNSLQSSIKQCNNTFSVPFCNEQNAKNLSEPVFKTLDEIPFDQIKFRANQRSSVSEPVFKTLDETPFDQIKFRACKKSSASEPVFKSLDEKPFKEIDSCVTKESSNATVSSNLLQPSKEIFTKAISVPLHKEQNVQILSKSELVSKTPVEPIEGPFKNVEKVKFYANKEPSSSTLLPASTNVLQSSVKQFEHSVPVCNKQRAFIRPKLKQTFIAPSLNENTSPFQIKDIFIEMNNGIRIISALGIPFINHFTEIVKRRVGKSFLPSKILLSVCNELKCQFGFKFVQDPDSVIQHEIFCGKFFLRHCLISCVTSIHKKRTRELCAEVAINTLVKLSIIGNKPLYKYKVNTSADTVSRKIYNSIEICELFHKNIIKGIKDEPALMTIKVIALLENVEDYIVFNVVSNVISETVTHYTCKFLINDTLISSATNETSYIAKCIAAELGIIKLSNLPEYIIHQGELKKKLHRNNKTIYSDIPSSSKKNSDLETNNLKRPSFILNSKLFDSSLKDGILVIEKDKDITDIHKSPLQNLLKEISTFCQKEYCMKTEEAGDIKSLYKKVKVFFGETEVGAGLAGSAAHAKPIACVKAYINMKMKYYSIKIKDGYIDGFLINRDQVYYGEPYFKNSLKNNYIECKKVKKGFHIYFPEKNTRSCIKITAEQSLNTDKNALFQKSAVPFFSADLSLFRSKIQEMLKHFKESEDYCDLLFSEEFFTAEKNEIIQTCEKMEICYQWLKTSYNYGKLLCVRHKYEVPKLLSYLVKNGGSNCKFELIDASTTVI